MECSLVQEHLLSCAACRQVAPALSPPPLADGGEDERPSEAARLRLRRAVAARYAPRPFWRRPIPLYQGAVAVMAVVLLFVALRERPSLPAWPAPVAAAEVDSARPVMTNEILY